MKWSIAYLLLLGSIRWQFQQVQDTPLGRLIVALRFALAGTAVGLLMGDAVFRFRHSTIDLIGVPVIIVGGLAAVAWLSGKGTRRESESNTAVLKKALVVKTVIHYGGSLVLSGGIGFVFRGLGEYFFAAFFIIVVLLWVMPNFFKVWKDDGPSTGLLIKDIVTKVSSKYASESRSPSGSLERFRKPSFLMRGETSGSFPL